MPIRSAQLGDVAAIEELLRADGLPRQDCHEHLATFLVVEQDGVLIGVGGLECHGSLGLIRSIAVERDHRGTGMGRRIHEELQRLAIAKGIERLYLLTETAQHYFAHLGYRVIAREQVPAVIQGTRQFRGLYPDTATVMFRDIGGADT